MAPSTKGLSLFSLSSKKEKAAKSKKNAVEGDMVLKQDAKASEPAVDPKKAMLADPKKAAAEPAKKVEQTPSKPEAAKASSAPVSTGIKPPATSAVTPIAIDNKTAATAEAKKEEKKQEPAPAKTETAPAKKEEPKPAKKEEAAPVKKEEPKEAAVEAKSAAVKTPTAVLPPGPVVVPASPAQHAPVMPPAVTKEAAAPAAPAAPALAAPAPAPALAAPAPAPAAFVPTPAPAKENLMAPVSLPLAAEAAAKAAEMAVAAAKAAAAKEAAAIETAQREAAAEAAAAAAAAAVPVPVSPPKMPSSSSSSSKVKKPVVQPVPDPCPVGKICAEDARAAWQTRPRMPVRLLDSYVNFMVCGESGLGKTTFINNLVSSYTVANNVHDGSSTSLADFQSDPDSLKTVLEPMEVREAGRRLHVTVQDMPGWADDINLVRYLRIMVNFILSQRAKDYEMLAGGRALNESAMCGQLQNSITACVYFLTPHRVKKVDLIMMSALSQLVTVIPVVAKADTMTDEELAQFRQEIRTRLAAPFKFVTSKTLAPLDFNHFVFDEAVMGALGLKQEMLPLAIITSNKHELVEDADLLAQLGLSADKVEQPVRAYKWGQAYALNREHSDLIILKRLLLGDRVDSLYAMLDESYNRYVAFCEQYEEAGKQLPLIVQDELACSAYLEYDDYSNAKSALDAAQQAMSTLMAENRSLVERLNALEKEKGAARFRSSTSTPGL